MQHLANRLYATRHDQAQALRAPFPLDEVVTKWVGGKSKHYYDHKTVRQRLDDVLGTGLTITPGEVRESDSLVEIEVSLDIRWVDGSSRTVTAWGASQIFRVGSKITNRPYEWALMAAVTQAAKKLGVGAELDDPAYLLQLSRGA